MDFDHIGAALLEADADDQHDQIPLAHKTFADQQIRTAGDQALGVEGDAPALTVSVEWTRYYIGLTDMWVGADVAVVPHGKGRLILSQLRLLENLGKDPVADRLFYNMIRFGSTGATREKRR